MQQTQPQKTVADIWNEVREEQRRFNRVLRYLFGALIAAFLIAAVAAYLSWTSLNNMSLAVQDRVEKASVEMEISTSDTKRRSEELRGETIRIREQLEEQRRFVDMEKRVDRALALSSPQRAAGTIDSLAREAVSVAEAAATGRRLNDATAYLVKTFSDEIGSGENSQMSGLFSGDEKRLLNAVLADWKSPEAGDTKEGWKRLSIEGSSRYSRGLGFAGLGLWHYRDAEKPKNSLGWDKGCQMAVDLIQEARRHGVESGTLLLSEGECLRKNGDKVAAFKAFLGALTLHAAPTDPGAIPPGINERRKAAHGAGTTLIAIQAAANSDAVLAAQLEGFMRELSDLRLEETASEANRASCPQEIRNGQVALRDACLLLERAADLRTQRGEGEIGRIYTRENIGFIHLLNEDWARAEAHARAIDEELTAAWNLTVLIIALDKLAAQPGGASRYAADAEFYRHKMRYLKVGDLDEAEIRKLLHPQFGTLVDELKASMKPD